MFKTRRGFSAGNAFSQSLNAQNFLRFNVAQSVDPRIFETLKNVLAQQQSLT